MSEDTSARGLRQTVLAKMPPFALVCAGLAFSVLAAAWTQRTLNESKRLAFQDHASDLVAELRHQVGRHMAHLEGIGSFFRASERVEREEFRLFVSPLLAGYQSIDAIAWLPRISDSGLPDFLEEARGAGFEGYAVWEVDASGQRCPPMGRDIRFPVLYVEPYEENRGAPGFDPQSQPSRAQAIHEACRTGNAQATGIFRGVHQTEEQQGFFVFFPVFGPEYDADTGDSEPVQGLIAVFFRIPDVVEEILARRPIVRSAVDIHDVTDMSGTPGPFCAYVPPESARAVAHDWLRYEERIGIAGRTWLVRCVPTDLFLESQSSAAAWVVLLLGFALTAFVSTYIASLRMSLVQSNLRIAAEKRARQESEARLREREAAEAKERLLASIVESTQDAIIGIDSQGLIASWNRGAEQIYGHRADEILGKPVQRLLPAENAQEAEHLRTACAEGEPVRNLETEHVRSDNEHIQVSLTLSPIQNTGVHPRGVSMIARDITLLREAEAVQRALEQQMREAQRMESLGVLASGVAHDFNNLLTGILGNADLILATAQPGSATHREALEIVHTAERAADLARQMLAYSGKGQVTVEPIRLDDLVLEMAQLLEASVSKKVQFSYQFAPNLPLIDADATQVRQVIMNLILNAAEAMGESGGLITLRTNTVPDAAALTAGTVFEGAVSESPHVCLEVEDTGPGMDEETVARIFDPFFTTKYAGHGLGLSTVHGVVRAHRGAIIVDSKPGRGTRFSLLFPAAELSTHEKADVPHAGAWHGSGRVLVVEDDPPVRDVTCRLLERFGYSARPAASGAEAIACLKEGTNDYRAVILDYRMPLMSGYETFLEIRAMRPGLPVLMVSGYTPDDIAGRFHDSTPDAILQKPYSANSLVEALRKILCESGAKENGS